MEINPFAAYLLKTGQLLCSALGMEDKNIYSPEQFTNQLEPKSNGEDVIREMNVIEVECALYAWSAANFINTEGRHRTYNRPTQKLIVDLVTILQRVHYWHLADWLDRSQRETSQYWGIRRHQNAPVWVTREPTPQEKLQDGVQKLHEELGINLIQL